MSPADLRALIERQDEEWRTIPSFPKYQASTMGRVRSLWLYRGNRYLPRDEPLIMEQFLSNRGYMRVPIADRSRAVHVMVLEAFVGPRPAGLECAHLNGVRTDNRLSNLMWASKTLNAAHRLLHGTHRYGESAYNAKLTDDAVRAIRSRYKPRSIGASSSAALAAEFGISREHVQKVAKGVAWTHIK
jgi:hypothetical protein